MFEGSWKMLLLAVVMLLIFFAWNHDFVMIEKRSKEKKSDIKILVKCWGRSNVLFSFPGTRPINPQGLFEYHSTLVRIRVILAMSADMCFNKRNVSCAFAVQKKYTHFIAKLMKFEYH